MRTANGLVCDIVFRGEDAREKITFYPEQKVVFVRLSGNADGFIVNEVLGPDDDLRLRFSFALQLVDAPSDSPKEREFREIMERDYLSKHDGFYRNPASVRFRSDRVVFQDSVATTAGLQSFDPAVT